MFNRKHNKLSKSQVDEIVYHQMSLNAVRTVRQIARAVQIPTWKVEDSLHRLKAASLVRQKRYPANSPLDVKQVWLLTLRDDLMTPTHYRDQLDTQIWWWLENVRPSTAEDIAEELQVDYLDTHRRLTRMWERGGVAMVIPTDEPDPVTTVWRYVD